MPRVKEYASCFCSERDCVICQEPIHLFSKVSEEGRSRVFLKRECLLKRRTSKRASGISPVSWTVNISMWTYITDAKLYRLHKNDPWLLLIPTGLCPQSYMTSRETINVAQVFSNTFMSKHKFLLTLFTNSLVSDNAGNPFILPSQCPWPLTAQALSPWPPLLLL